MLKVDYGEPARRTVAVLQHKVVKIKIAVAKLQLLMREIRPS